VRTQPTPESPSRRASFGHTFTWGGITSVVDADMGQPITDSLERGLGNQCPGGRQATKRTQGD